MSEEKRKAVEVSFDLSKQFISLAFAGVAFAVGVSTAESEAGSMFGWIVFFFALSCVLGFLFLMNGTSSLSAGKIYDINAALPMILVSGQIILVILGVGFLLKLHLNGLGSDDMPVAPEEAVKIEVNGRTIAVPPDASMKVTISPDGVITLDQQPRKKQ